MRQSALPTLALLAIGLASLSTAVVAATMPPVTMKIVDGRDGKPIQGVVAFFTETAHEGTLTGHGGRGVLLFAAEAISDEAGEVRFPEQEFASQPFFLDTVRENPEMLLLKPGYAPLTLRNELHLFPTLAEASAWEHDGKTVTMKPPKKEDPYNMEAYLTGLRTNLALGMDPRACTWKRVPRTLVVADRMFQESGRTSALRTLLMNDALYAREGCGSAKAFFAPYLETTR